MLAHKATHEGRVAAEAISRRAAAFEPRAIPAVVFTDPEVAWCGLTDLRPRRRPAREGRRFPWGASVAGQPRSAASVSVTVGHRPESERVLSVGIVGAGASALIAEGVLAVEMGAVASDLELSMRPPTLSEALSNREAFFGRSTHFYRQAAAWAGPSRTCESYS